jgi:hypothetical protein
MPTRFMQQIYENVDKAMAYEPGKEERPRFDLQGKKPEKIVIQSNLTAVQAARAHKKKMS